MKIAGLAVVGLFASASLTQAAPLSPTEGFYEIVAFKADPDQAHDCEMSGEPVGGLDQIVLGNDRQFEVILWIVAPYGSWPMMAVPCEFRSASNRPYTCEFPEQVLDFTFAGIDAVVTIASGEVHGTWTSATTYLWHHREQGMVCEGTACDFVSMMMFSQFGVFPCGEHDVYMTEKHLTAPPF